MIVMVSKETPVFDEQGLIADFVWLLSKHSIEKYEELK